jgi:HSP20 family protein
VRLSDLESRMWAEALEMLERAERLKRQFFLPPAAGSRGASWAPPVDVLETPEAFVVLVAVPDVDPTRIELSFGNGTLLISGERRLPASLAGAAIRRLEIPQGRFERRMRVAARSLVRSECSNGCLTVVLNK